MRAEQITATAAAPTAVAGAAEQVTDAIQRL
ncbi:hypothetical protein BJY14_008363 [Actinomadura luteofluorescens]|uniref:Uncharacterized protein n=1 Tax=Actinomadura luteofluorescens TaxID=46163 RepID=A0A7Y9ER13_9ACTN|nr:hypothetical protein [Actinomadura luteofluorescens]